MEAKAILYECGICDCLHPWNWSGDCRENDNRFDSVEDYADVYDLSVLDIQVHSWQDRQDADEKEAQL